MSRQMLAVIVGAVLLFAVAVVGAMAFTSGDSNPSGNVHTMPDGSVMTEPMGGGGKTTTDDDDSMMGEDDDSMMDEGEDSMMDDGEDSMMDDGEDSMMDDDMGMTP